MELIRAHMIIFLLRQRFLFLYDKNKIKIKIREVLYAPVCFNFLSAHNVMGLPGWQRRIPQRATPALQTPNFSCSEQTTVCSVLHSDGQKGLSTGPFDRRLPRHRDGEGAIDHSPSRTHNTLPRMDYVAVSVRGLSTASRSSSNLFNVICGSTTN